ncbi:hypothetical protein [Alicyclobacillus sp. SO9]|uniref:hypothetical protein n=1 Tax=Alicyclobacillus sp. SO9 TaxID=2665646 RepID=UPI0018E860A5|nr:hypothetical protein [Alicyclobacillus sp. SO9]QQE78684.1 hypothetical protein GI364_22985 [Alicyclobacillus sp. SO9]
MSEKHEPIERYALLSKMELSSKEQNQIWMDVERRISQSFPAKRHRRRFHAVKTSTAAVAAMAVFAGGLYALSKHSFILTTNDSKETPSKPALVTLQSLKPSVTLPNGTSLNFVAARKDREWQVRNAQNQVIASGPLYGKFKGNKVYQTEYEFSKWKVNNSWAILELDEGVKGFTQPVALRLFAIQVNAQNQRPAAFASGQNWGGMHFTWRLQGDTVEAVQKTLDSKGNTIVKFRINKHLH